MRRRAAAALAVLAACAHQGSARLALPSAWDDRRLEGALAEAKSRSVLAVLPFETGAVAQQGALRISDMLTTALLRSGRVVLVEREKIERVLDEQRFRLTGAVDDASKAAEVGKLLGADAVVFGAVTSATQETTDHFAYDLTRTEVRLDARAVDTTTGQLLFSESGEGASDAKIVRSADGTLISGLRDAGEEFRKAAANATVPLAQHIGALFPPLGFLVGGDGEELVTDLGAGRGVSVGDELVVFRVGDKLLHPVTHQWLGYQKRLLDVLVVRAVEQQRSVVARRNVSEDPLQAGDVVVRVAP